MHLPGDVFRFEGSTEFGGGGVSLGVEGVAAAATALAAHMACIQFSVICEASSNFACKITKNVELLSKRLMIYSMAI
jgi:hypothetical protein